MCNLYTCITIRENLLDLISFVKLQIGQIEKFKSLIDLGLIKPGKSRSQYIRNISSPETTLINTSAAGERSNFSSDVVGEIDGKKESQ